jgi:hypothetical protein
MIKIRISLIDKSFLLFEHGINKKTLPADYAIGAGNINDVIVVSHKSDGKEERSLCKSFGFCGMQRIFWYVTLTKEETSAELDRKAFYVAGKYERSMDGRKKIKWEA